MKAKQLNKSKLASKKQKKGTQLQNAIKVYNLFGELVATEMNQTQKTITEILNYTWTMNKPQL